jgi:hypothetical protein
MMSGKKQDWERGTEETMRRIAVATAILVGVVGLALGSFGAETIVTSGGSVLSGVIESGLPAAVSITSETGDVFTVQRANMKHVRFGEERRVTVETLDGNIIIGTLGGISDVFGLRTPGGDVQSISVDSIVEIRFEPPAAPVAPALPPVVPAPPPVVPVASSSIVQAVVDAYVDGSGSFTLGIDSGLQLGYSGKNGFELPRFTIGVNGILLGVVGRLYFPPSADRIERTAERLVGDGIGDFETLLEETRTEATPFLLPYIQLGTDAITIPHVGGGLLFRLGRLIYFDVGATIDTVGVPWVSIGLLIFF